jgi:hypothetical protein
LWNDDERSETKYLEKKLSQCHYVYQNPTWTGMGSNWGLPGYTTASKCMDHSTTDQQVTE